MSYTATYRVRSHKAHDTFETQADALDFLLEEIDAVGAHPLGIWFDGQKLLDHDTIMSIYENQ